MTTDYYNDVLLVGCMVRTLVERWSLNGEFPCSEVDLQLTADHLCASTVRCRSANQADSAFHPFG